MANNAMLTVRSSATEVMLNTVHGIIKNTKVLCKKFHMLINHFQIGLIIIFFPSITNSSS